MRKQKRSAVVLEPDAAGVDIGAEEIYVAVPPDRDEESTRKFSTFTRDLNALADWLERCRVRTVAMESTGVYWIPLFQILEERGFHGVSGQRSLPEECSRPKERRLRLPVDPVSALGWPASCELSTARSYLCCASALEASRQLITDGRRTHHAYAKGAEPDEPADPSRA